MRKNKGSKSIFTILYIIGFLGAGLIGFFGDSFFAYDIFNSLWSDILYLIFISLMFVTAFCHEIYTSHTVSNIILNFAIFIVGLIFFLLFIIFGGVFTLCLIIFSATMLIVICCRYALLLRKNPQTKQNVDIKQIACIGSLLLFAMLRQMNVEYVNDMFMVWALIPTAVISVVVGIVVIVLLKRVWANIFPTKIKRILGALGIGWLIFIVAFTYSFTTIGTINSAFDGDPVKMEYTVIDKVVHSGSRTVTQFKVKVLIDEKERWISVPSTDYYEISEGDTIIIDYHSGALNFAYYYYNSKG